MIGLQMFPITERLTSKQNPRIKNLIQLQKSSERIRQNLFVIEGLKEIEKAIHSGYELESLFYCPQIINNEEITRLFITNKPRQVFEISKEIFEKVAYRENSGGIVLVAKSKLHNFSILPNLANPLILVIEGVEKPGNIGAIYRTADAAGISAIIISNPATDFYNPNAVRASLGCVFSIPTVICSTNEAIKWLKEKNIKIYSSYLEASIPYYQANFKQASAIVMGTEATGITREWIQASDANIIIPMHGMADSMNVSTAAAVLIFEARRQRDFN